MAKRNPETAMYRIVKYDFEKLEELEVLPKKVKGIDAAVMTVQTLNRELQERGEDREKRVRHFYE